MPTELNLVLYETAARVALVAGISAGALVFAAATVQRNVIPLPGALAMLLVAAVWLLASIVLWQQSPRLFQALGVYRHE